MDLSTILLAVHETASSLLSIEELSIDESEADKLAEKIRKVAAFYPNSGLPPKVMAWLELGCACTMIYGTRIKAYSLRKSKEKPKMDLPKPQVVPKQPFTNQKIVNGKPLGEVSPSEIFGFQGASDE